MYIYEYPYGERQILLPFLLGGIAGAGAVSLARPKPIFVANQAPQGPMVNPYMPAGNYNYSYYVPY